MCARHIMHMRVHAFLHNKLDNNNTHWIYLSTKKTKKYLACKNLITPHRIHTTQTAQEHILIMYEWGEKQALVRPCM